LGHVDRVAGKLDGLKDFAHGPWPWYQTAVAQLAAGRVDLFTKTCDQFRLRFGDPNNLRDLDIAHLLNNACCLRPETAKGFPASRDLLLRVLNDPKNKQNPALIWHFGTAGMFLYRQGMYQQAAPYLIQSVASNYPPCSALAESFLAMTYKRAGRDREARLALEEAKRLVSSMGEPKMQDWGETVFNILACRIALAEAQQVVAGQAGRN